MARDTRCDKYECDSCRRTFKTALYLNQGTEVVLMYCRSCGSAVCDRCSHWEHVRWSKCQGCGASALWERETVILEGAEPTPARPSRQRKTSKKHKKKGSSTKQFGALGIVLLAGFLLGLGYGGYRLYGWLVAVPPAPGAEPPQALIPGDLQAAEAEAAIHEERKKLEGTWLLISERMRGSQLVIEPNTAKTTFTGSSVQWRGGPAAEYEINLKTVPKQLASTGPGGPWRAIYKLEGDTLTVCTSNSPMPPTEFTGERAEGNPRLQTYSRQPDRKIAEATTPEANP